MGSTHRGTIYHMVKTNKVGSKVAVSAQKGAEVTNTTPQRGHAYDLASSQRSGTASMIPSAHRRSEAGHSTIPHLASEYPRSSSPHSGPGVSGAPSCRTETRSKSEAYRHAVQMQRNVSTSREEATRRGGESKPGRDINNRYSLIPDAKSSRRLSFVDQKDNFTILEEDPPSKVQYPQGVRVPHRPLVYPKDEAVQTEPTRKSLTAADIRSPRRPSSPERSDNRICTDSRPTQRRIPGQESEMGCQNSIYTEPKALHRSTNLESSLRLSFLKDLDGGHKVSMRPEPESIHKHSVYTETKSFPKALISSEVEPNVKSSIRGDSEGGRRVTISPGGQSASRVTSRAVSESPRKSSTFVSPEPIYKQHTTRPSKSTYVSSGPTLRHPEPSGKPSVHAELELTPRPLPPRSLPRYGPDSSWWALLNPEVEMSQSRPITLDSEPKSPSPVDPSMPFFEMESSPFCEDLMFQRRKASPSPPPSPKESPSLEPRREVPQVPKHTSKQPIQRFSALDRKSVV